MQNANAEAVTPKPGDRCARLHVYQTPRNPTARDRAILALIAEGHTQKQAAWHLGLKPRSVTNALGHMRNRYTAPTNETLIALAIRLQWISIAIECEDELATPKHPPSADGTSAHMPTNRQAPNVHTDPSRSGAKP